MATKKKNKKKEEKKNNNKQWIKEQMQKQLDHIAKKDKKIKKFVKPAVMEFGETECGCCGQILKVEKCKCDYLQCDLCREEREEEQRRDALDMLEEQERLDETEEYKREMKDEGF